MVGYSNQKLQKGIGKVKKKFMRAVLMLLMTMKL